MQLTRYDPSRDKQGGGAGTWALGIFAGALLIVFGFAIAVVGVMEGVISQDQLRTLFTGENPGSAPASSAPEPVSPAVAGAPVASATTPVLPPEQQARVLRDETFGDWRFVCLEAREDAAPQCSVSQQLRVAESGAAVFVWRIVQDGRGGLVGIWQVPETVLLTAGLTLDAGAPEPLVIPFESCGGGSCRVVANLAPDFIETLSSAETLSASVVLTNRQALTFPLSANGIDEALAALAE
ncbi:MAG TPA: invasion associated locus B family protein [Devosiaceae bacterium]|jgi:invasion protein IalB|nr:invasion associated locus B family protein [Devosiaceae bacterium]